jgi:hypothetical protein
MADPTRDPTPAPQDPWPAPDDAHVRQIVDALTAPATPEELADEARYLAAFTAVAAAPSSPSRRRRRGRLVVAGAAAALAVTGTAAAVTGTIGRTTTPDARTPATSSAPAPTTSAPTGSSIPSTASSVDRSNQPARTPASTNSPPATGPVATGPPATSPPTPSTSATPTASSEKQLPTPALREACRAYLRGKLKEDSKRYRDLVEAAGGATRVRAYCETVATPEPQP